MRQILAAEYDQTLLLAPSVEDWIGPEHPARFIREFVAALDLKAIGLDKVSREEGGVAYDPRLLLSAWLYGYMRKVRSTRAVERACREDVGFIWLTGNHRPDHNALWRFWTGHREAVRGLFERSVKVAIEMNLVGLAVQAVDGTKLMAAGSARGAFDQKHLEKLLGELDVQIAEREKQIAQTGPEPVAELPAQLRRACQLREQVRGALQRVVAGESKHAHPKDPDAARMECEGRNRFAYNAQAVVDAKSQVILASEITSAPNDAKELVKMTAQAQQNCEPTQSAPLTLADGGYANAAQLEAARDGGYDVRTPPPNAWRATEDPYHAAHFRHDPQRKVVICPQNRELPWQRTRLKKGKLIEVYRSAQVCKDCPVRALCTQDRHGRSIDIQPGHAAVVAAHRLWHEPATQELYQLRAATVEPVFAQIKHHMGFRRFCVRGRDNVRAQWAWLCLSWNLKVLFRAQRCDGGLNPGGCSPTPPPRAPSDGPSSLPSPRHPLRQRGEDRGWRRFVGWFVAFAVNCQHRADSPGPRCAVFAFAL